MPELIWDGKYDENGKRVAVPKLALPFQTIEIVNEDNAARERTLSLFSEGRETDWRNRLFWGDKKWVLPSLLPEFGGKVDLIYIDPPFDTGADFSFSAQIPDDPNTPGDQSQSFVKEPSVLEIKAYRDIWGGATTHLDAYLKWFYETIVVLYDLLSPTGSIYVHLDYNVGHYAKAALDEVFGADRFINEIIWSYDYGARSTKRWSTKHDTILWYAKDPANYTFRYADIDRIPYMAPGLVGPEKAARGKTPTDVWWNTIVSPNGKEKTGYPTQKPLAILNRIVRVHSNPGDRTLDFFAGSGSFGEAAARNDREFVLIDQNPQAIAVMERRLAFANPVIYRNTEG